MKNVRLLSMATVLVLTIFTLILQPAPAMAVTLNQESTPVPNDEKEKADAIFQEALNLFFAQDYDSALPKLQEAREMYRMLGDLEQEAVTLTGIGLCYFNTDKSEKAFAAQQEALVLARKAGSREVEADALINSGQVQIIFFGQYQESLDNFESALAISKEIDYAPGQAASMLGLGYASRELGHYEQALQYFREALKVSEEIDYQDGMAEALNSMGATYLALGQYEQALIYYEKSLPIAEKLGNREGIESILNNIGTANLYLQNYEQAIDTLKECLSIAKMINDKDGQAVTLHNIGAAYNKMMEYDQALEYQTQALMINQELGLKAREGTVLNSIGLTYHNLKQEDKALENLQKALDIFQAVGSRKGQGTALHNLGLVYEAQGDSDHAIRYYQQSIDVIESIQSNIKVDQLKTSFADEQVDTNAALINLLWSKSRFEEALNYTERSRARALLDQLASGSVDFRAGAADNLITQEESLRVEINSLRQKLVELRNRPSDEWDTETIANVETDLASREADYSKFLIELKEQSPEVASLVSVDVASLSQIQSLLEPNTTLIEYFVLKDRTLVFVITRDTFEPVTLNVSKKDLEQTISTYRDFASLDDPFPDSLKQLYTWLIVPLKDKLKTHVVGIVSHGALHYLPFAALTDGKDYFGDDYVLFSLPSASTLRFIQDKRKPVANTVLAIGNPTSGEPDLKPLHFAQKEVESISKLYGTQPLVGDAASETAVREQAGDMAILHLAAHGEYNKYNPLFSAIYLAGDTENDGRLEVNEIYGLDLTKNTNLVILSACETDIGTIGAGEEVIGLTRAFLYAGSPTVIASLWNVDDQSTALLMERFYTYLRAGMSKGEALQKAQLDVRKEYPHPYYWAGFVLTGDVGLSSEQASSKYPILWTAAIGSLLLTVVVAVRRKRIKKIP